MSHMFYNELWKKGMRQLSALLEDENLMHHSTGQSYEDLARGELFLRFADFYIRYIKVFRCIEECYNQIVHPQKRFDLRIVLDVVMCRLCQVKSELVKYNPSIGSEYVNLDDFLIESAVSASSLEIPIPRHFQEGSKSCSEQQVDILHQVFDVDKQETPEQMQEDVVVISEITVNDAVKLTDKKETEQPQQWLADKTTIKRTQQAATSELDAAAAAVKIQKIYRGYLTRREIQQKRIQELEFLGMAVPLNVGSPDQQNQHKIGLQLAYNCQNLIQKATAINKTRLSLGIDNEAEYNTDLNHIQDIVTEIEGSHMRDELWDERYNWWRKEKEISGEYPKSFDGFYMQKRKSEESNKETAEPDRKKKVENDNLKQKKASNKRNRNKRIQKHESEIKLPEISCEHSASLTSSSQAVNQKMKEILEKYRNVWMESTDDLQKLPESYDVELAKREVRPVVKEIIRQDVDDELLALLEKLRVEIQQQPHQRKKQINKKGTKRRGAKKKGAKKSGTKLKTKAKRGTQKRKVKTKKCCLGETACHGMTDAKMVSELARLNILQKIDGFQNFTDFVGNFNPLTTSDSVPTLAQIRQLCIEYGVLPLGSDYVHRNSALISSLLLYGPRGSGKTLLSRAIANSVNATWFDLSPSNIIGKIQDSDVSKIVHMTFEVAKIYEPSVIYINEIENIFCSPKKSSQSDSASKMKKLLQLHKAKIGKEFRILLIGSSSTSHHEPVHQKEFQKMFKSEGKMLFCPFPDYLSRIKLWRHFIEKVCLELIDCDSRKVNINTLAYITEGFTAGSIKQCVEEVFTERRSSGRGHSHEERCVQTSEFLSKILSSNCIQHDQHLHSKFFHDTNWNSQKMN